MTCAAGDGIGFAGAADMRPSLSASRERALAGRWGGREEGISWIACLQESLEKKTGFFAARRDRGSEIGNLCGLAVFCGVCWCFCRRGVGWG